MSQQYRKYRLTLSLIIFLLVNVHQGTGQIVPNGKFENYKNCPDDQGDIYEAVPWDGFSYTSDYFNACDTNDYVGVPINGPGYQPAHSGKGCTGIIVTWNNQAYDYIYAPLNPLQKGKAYCLSMVVSCADKPKKATDDLCIFLTNQQPNKNVISNNQHVVRNPRQRIITDTTGWTYITGDFIAQGDEKYIAIGSCMDEPRSKEVINPGSTFGPTTYYYIDDVQIRPLDTSMSIVMKDSTQLCNGRQAFTLSTQFDSTDLQSYRWSTQDTTPAITVEGYSTYWLKAQSKTFCQTFHDTFSIDQDPPADSKIFVPDAFTPNDDGRNDVLKVYGAEQGEDRVFDFRVYDRWGTLVFHTNDPDAGWNGYYQNKKRPAGVYMYYLRTTCRNKKPVVKQGDITLIR